MVNVAVVMGGEVSSNGWVLVASGGYARGQLQFDAFSWQKIERGGVLEETGGIAPQGQTHVISRDACRRRAEISRRPP